MCTAVTFKTNDHYFGRNLDLEYHYQEAVTITPRNYPFSFRMDLLLKSHLAMIGIATIADGYPLYYDATNEAGLSMAGLNFPGNAVYASPVSGKDNIAPFELIPWILGQCRTVAQAREKIAKLNIVNIHFGKAYPLSPLHWILADATEAITLESVSDGLKVYENPVGVLTNNPPFDYHMHHLQAYLNLTHEEPVNRFSEHLLLKPYSRGMGAIGLPGDLSSPSRFVRAAFTKWNSRCDGSQTESVGQFFHILNAVAQQQGCVKVDKGFEKTVYSSCCNTDRCIYYYTTYWNSQITAVELLHEDLDSVCLVSYPLRTAPSIQREN